MAYLEKFLVIKPSTLPDAGMGLFTKTFIAAGTRVVEYKGRVTTWKEVEHDHDNVYLFTVTPNHVIDARRSLKSFSRYANDARGFTRIKGVTNNAIYVQDENNRVFLEAKRDIPAGAEIFVSYGNDYWKVMRENKKIEKANEKEEAAKSKKGTSKKGTSVKKGKPQKKAAAKKKR
jgi:SET domain-containing protein